MGFDFAGTCMGVEHHQRIESVFGDRTLLVEFNPEAGGIKLRETFGPDAAQSDASASKAFQSGAAGFSALNGWMTTWFAPLSK